MNSNVHDGVHVQKNTIVMGIFFLGMLLLGLSFFASINLQQSSRNTGVLGVTSGSLTTANYPSEAGSITSSPAGINCGSDCAEAGQVGNTFTLTASPAAGRIVYGWNVIVGLEYGSESGSCSEGIQSGPTCTVTVSTYGTDVYVSYIYNTYNVTVTKSGNGSGTVTGNGLNCGTDCNGSWAHNSSITLTATPAAGSVFSGWQTGATNCQTLTGKGGGEAVNTNPVCTISSANSVQNKTAFAKFTSDGSSPAAGSSPSQPTANSPTPTTSTTEPVADVKSQPPTASLKDSAGNDIVSTKEAPAVFESGKPIILSGITVPNGEIKLYIFSEPQEATVTADDQGAWTYTIASIEPGEHRVEVEVTDPETGETSERAEVLAFSVTQAQPEEDSTVEEFAEETNEDDNISSLPLILLLVAVLLGIGAGAYWTFRKRKSKKTPKNPADTNVTNPNHPEPENNIENDSESDTKQDEV